MIDGKKPTFGGEIRRQMPVAEDSRVVGLGHERDKRSGDRRVDRVSAGAKRTQAGIGGERMAGGDNAASGGETFA
ncbi:MAG: hypothetical protein ACRDMJ_20195 [Solirubrobacteraceae bacterium]